MDEMKYEKLTEINGRPDAEILESYLEAEGIDVELFQESIGHSSYARIFPAISESKFILGIIPSNK